tara:strand:- start:479 stop:1018 length:540 start_codon:yes stop_codon:yes gene_type:complete
MKHFVYKTYNEISGKFYIGRHSTDNINDGYQGSGTWVKRSLKKGNKLITEILEYAKDIKSLMKLEEQHIKNYFDDPKNTNGKLSSQGMTREDVLGEKNPMYGKTHTQEVKDIISKTKTGRKHTKDHIDKTTRKGKENGMFGVRRMGEDNPNYKGGITNDPNYYRDYSRAKRLQRKQIGL